MSAKSDDLMLETLDLCRAILVDGKCADKDMAGAFRLAADLGGDNSIVTSEFRHAARIFDELAKLREQAIGRIEASIKWRRPGNTRPPDSRLDT